MPSRTADVFDLARVSRKAWVSSRKFWTFWTLAETSALTVSMSASGTPTAPSRRQSIESMSSSSSASAGTFCPATSSVDLVTSYATSSSFLAYCVGETREPVLSSSLSPSLSLCLSLSPVRNQPRRRSRQSESSPGPWPRRKSPGQCSGETWQPGAWTRKRPES